MTRRSDITGQGRAGKSCSFDPCGRRAVKRGLCAAHYDQKRRTGVLVPIGSRCEPRAVIANPDGSGSFLVTLTQGRFAIIDAVDAAEVGKRNWSLVRGTFNARDYAQAAGIPRLHRFIAKLAGIVGQEIDHRNGDGLDCRRSNLRGATHAENMRNQRPRSDNASGYKGVSRYRDRWRATIAANGRWRHLGYFTDPKKAHAAYAAAARELHGEFARLE